MVKQTKSQKQKSQIQLVVIDMSRQFPFSLCSGSNRELNPRSMRGGEESAPQVTDNCSSGGGLTRDRGPPSDGGLLN